MAGLGFREVTKCLTKVIEFLDPYLPLANAHPSNFITEDQWSSLLTDVMQQQLISLPEDKLKTLPCFQISTTQGKKDTNTNNDPSSDNFVVSGTDSHASQFKYPNQNHTQKSEAKEVNRKQQHSGIKEFCQKAFMSTLEYGDLAIQRESFISVLDIKQSKDAFVRDFMNQKKGHEVEILSRICALLIRATNGQLVIDFGSGKGYLGAHLCLQYDIPVLGIDAMSAYTHSAEKRMDILGTQWKGLSLNVKSSIEGKKLTKKEKKRARNSDTSQVESDENRFGKNVNTEKAANGVTEKNTDLEDHSTNSYSYSDNTKSCEVNKGSKYVPVTMFVDENTDFMTIAQDNFPEIFKDVHVVEDIHNDSVNKVKECTSPLLIETDLVESTLEEISDTRCDKAGEKLTDIVSQPSEKTSSVNTDDRRHAGSCNLLLTGLHTCGNLASSTLHLFVNNSDLKTVCSVGCCYNLLSEEFSQDRPKGERQGENETRSGFPMSQFLKAKRLSLGSSARNLASQSIHRISSVEEQLQGERFYPRALLEVLVQDVCGKDGVTWRGLRNLERKCSSTEEYLRRACGKLNISHLISEEMIQSYVEKYADYKKKLAAFFQLRAVLAPCIESLILLDRVCYLLEQGNIEKVYLVRLFDPVISPRCYGIIAFKQ